MCTLVQALRLCTGRTAHRESRGIALLYRHWGSVEDIRPIGGRRGIAVLYRHWGSVQDVRPIGGRRGIALPFLDHGIGRGWGVSVMPRPLFTPRKNPVPIVQVRKISPPPGFDPRTIQPVASHYNDWANWTTKCHWHIKYLLTISLFKSNYTNMLYKE